MSEAVLGGFPPLPVVKILGPASVQGLTRKQKPTEDYVLLKSARMEWGIELEKCILPRLALC